MSRFDLPHNFMHHKLERQEQAKRVSDKQQDKNNNQIEPKEKLVADNTVTQEQETVEASAQDIMADQNTGILRAQGHFNDVNTPGKVDISKKKLFDVAARSVIDYNEVSNIVEMSTEGTGGTTPPNGPAPTDENSTTITDEELYANREKYTQEYVDSLNIGLEASTFSRVLNTYFQKITINGNEVYILRNANLTQIKDLISQIYVTEKLTTAPDYIPSTPDENGGFVLTDQQTYNDRKANYYYMCYLNGISCTYHEFEDGTYNRDIARQCGLYDYQDVFVNYLEDEGVQKYLQENFGITISTPPSEEYIELWNKLANLAAIGEDGKNTGEYNKQNVLKYFGLALTDNQFMSFINKASYTQNENSITNNTWDIEAVKATISEKYPELLENSEVLTDEFLEWIGSNAFEFLLMNQSKLRANDMQDFVNYGNIPSWVTFNSGTEFNEELLLKCCIQSMASLAEMGTELGYDPKEFVNRELSDYVTEMYNNELGNLDVVQSAGGPNMAPRHGSSNSQIPDYVMNFLMEKYGANITVLDCRSVGKGWSIISNGKTICSIRESDFKCYLSSSYIEDPNFYTSIDAYSFEGGSAKPEYQYSYISILWTYYDEMSSGNTQYFSNGVDDLIDILKNVDIDTLAELGEYLYDISYDISEEEDSAKVAFWTDFLSHNTYKTIRDEDGLLHVVTTDFFGFVLETTETYLTLTNDTELLGYLNSDLSMDTALTVLRWVNRRIASQDKSFEWWNPDGIPLNTDVSQGYTGDCYLIASYLSAAQFPEIVQLLHEMVEIDYENQTYSITVGGTKYTFTFDEISKAKELSSGDDYLIVAEMAARKFYEQYYDSGLEGGDFEKFLLFITGGQSSINGGVFSFGCQCQNGVSDEDVNLMFEHIRSGNYVSVLGVEEDGLKVIDPTTGEEVDLPGCHAYSVVGVDSKYIYIINPWDSSKTLKLPIETFKNNLSNFEYWDIKKQDLIDLIKKSNSFPSWLQDNLEYGMYVDDNGDFNYDRFYADCEKNGILISDLPFIIRKTVDADGNWITRVEFNKFDGTPTVIATYSNYQNAIVEVGKPWISFSDTITTDMIKDMLEDLFYSMNSAGRVFVEINDWKSNLTYEDMQIIQETLPKFTIGNWLDTSALKLLMGYFISEDGSFDSAGYQALMSNFNNFDDVERFAQSVLKYEQVQAAMMHNNAEAAIYSLQSWAEDRLARLRAQGSIYTEMSYWNWQDVLFNPFASTEDYLAAINAMNSIVNAAKSIGVSLDAYISMSPSERERMRGRLQAPLPDDFISQVNYYAEYDADGNIIYYSIPNQSSCTEAPEWFKEYLENGGSLDNYEIGVHIIEQTNTEEEQKLYNERQQYQYWRSMNNSLLEGLSTAEQYGLYTMDMMYFNMWLSTNAIIEGYDPDTDWEELYEAYCESDLKLF